MNSDNESRIINIEMKISHQDVMLEELHQVIYRQQAEIDLLNKKLKLLQEQFASDSEIRPAGEKPPHY
jgi:SlyX protein